MTMSLFSQSRTMLLAAMICSVSASDADSTPVPPYQISIVEELPEDNILNVGNQTLDTKTDLQNVIDTFSGLLNVNWEIVNQHRKVPSVYASYELEKYGEEYYTMISPDSQCHYTALKEWFEKMPFQFVESGLCTPEGNEEKVKADNEAAAKIKIARELKQKQAYLVATQKRDIVQEAVRKEKSAAPAQSEAQAFTLTPVEARAPSVPRTTPKPACTKGRKSAPRKRATSPKAVQQAAVSGLPETYAALESLRTAELQQLLDHPKLKTLPSYVKTMKKKMLRRKIAQALGLKPETRRRVLERLVRETERSARS